MERKFVKGDIVRHFKREKLSNEELKNEPNKYLYEIMGIARHTESDEVLMVYKPLYDADCVKDVNYAVRPLSMFTSEVDHEKYPEIKQKYRFEKVEE